MKQKSNVARPHGQAQGNASVAGSSKERGARSTRRTMELERKAIEAEWESLKNARARIDGAESAFEERMVSVEAEFATREQALDARESELSGLAEQEEFLRQAKNEFRVEIARTEEEKLRLAEWEENLRVLEEEVDRRRAKSMAEVERIKQELDRARKAVEAEAAALASRRGEWERVLRAEKTRLEAEFEELEEARADIARRERGLRHASANRGKRVGAVAGKMEASEKAIWEERSALESLRTVAGVS